MTLIQAIVLAIIEGITEYLPVSSTGHMVLASSFFGIAKDDFVKLFTVAIQFGAILSVLVLYWKRFFKNLSFYFKLLIGFIPAMVFGFLFNDTIEALLENPVVVAVSLLIGGLFLLFIDQWFQSNETNTAIKYEYGKPQKVNTFISYQKALIIGFFQCIAMIPGVSRSAATIIGGMSQGLSRKTAAEFSFFLAVPTMFAATVKSLYDFYAKTYIDKNGFDLNGLIKHLELSITTNQIQLLAVGNLVAFIIAIIAIKSFVGFVSKNGFKLFGYYRILVGLVLLIIHFCIQKLDMM